MLGGIRGKSAQVIAKGRGQRAEGRREKI